MICLITQIKFGYVSNLLIFMAKNEEIWLIFFDELQAYVEAHGHLPDKHVVENRGLLSKAKYFRKKIKAGTAENWLVERFEGILAMRSNEHTGGRRKKSPN